MKILLCSLQVVRDPTLKVPRTVPAWELPILEAMYGEGNLEDVQQHEGEVDQILDPEQEMDRLIRVYGRDKETKVPNAELAYGRGPAGVRVLAASMKAAVIDSDGEDAPKRRGRPPKAEQDSE